jgi:two-component system, NarL family, nitrate/nitrite response regulator NarL
MSKNPTTQIEKASRPTRVAVLSDDALLRTALSSMLDRGGEVEVAELASADVVLWDPGADRARLEGKLGELARIQTPILALLPDPSQAQLVLGAGARGVMLRDRVGFPRSDGPSRPDGTSQSDGPMPTPLVSALRAVQGGLTVLDGALAEHLVGREQDGPDLLEELTAREREVVTLMVEGLSNKQIARRLSISEHTAKFHIGRILAKLDADTRTEAVVRALRFGLVTL